MKLNFSASHTTKSCQLQRLVDKLLLIIVMYLLSESHATRIQTLYAKCRFITLLQEVHIITTML